MKTSLESLQFHLTNRCNLGCVFCWRSYKNRQSLEEIDFGRFVELCKDACNLEPEEITISGGGEPLLRKDLCLEMADIIKENKIRGNLITSGIPLDREVCKKLVEIGWDEIIFSIQGYNAKMDDEIRQMEGSFKKTINNIKGLFQERGGEEKPKTRFQVVLTKYNSQNLPAFLEMAEGLGVEIVNFRLVNERGRNLSPRQDKKFRKNLKECEKLANNYSIDFRKEFELDGSSEENCSKPFRELVLFADGRVGPCCNFFEDLESNNLDRIRGKTLKDVWKGKKFEGLRKKFENKNYPKRCAECLKS